MKRSIVLLIIGLTVLFPIVPGHTASAQGGAIPITYGASAVGSITEDAPFAVYVFSGNAGDQITAYAVGITPQMVPSLSLLGTDGRQLAISVDDPFGDRESGVARISYRLPEEGVYSLMVSNVENTTGEFLLRLIGRPSDTATPISPGEPVTVNIGPDASPAVFRFTADPTSPITLSVLTQSPDLAFVAQVRDPEGRLIASMLGELLRGVNMVIAPGEGDYEVSVFGVEREMQGAVEISLALGEAVVTLSTPTPTEPPQPLATPTPSVCRVTSNRNVNIRTGPGTNYDIVGVLYAGSYLNVIGQNSSGTWYVVDYRGRRAWISGSVTTLEGPCAGLQVYTAPPTPTSVPPTPVPTSAAPQISFTVNGGTSATINPGDCVTIRWDVENIREVYYQGQGVVGHDQRTECPTSTTTYTLHVVLVDGSTTDRTVTVNVGAAASLNPGGSPTYGSLSLNPGFVPDPQTVGITSGGPVDVSYLGGGCYGYAASNPDFAVNWGGSAARLRFYFIGGGDTTMVVRAPNGAWHCNDDGAGYPNPLVNIEPSPAGRYDIWIASYNSGEAWSGTLYITEMNLP